PESAFHHESDTDERPREKMREKGLDALTDVELLAVLLHTGSGGMNVVELAREVYACHSGNLCTLSSASPDKLCEVKGIGFGKAATICAAFELGRRCARGKAFREVFVVRDPAAACALMSPAMRVLDHEECWAMFLNRKNRVVARQAVSSGGLAATAMDPRIVARMALEKKATSVILFHNHPSGCPLPGEADLNSTETLRQALSAIDVKLLDHIIIAGDSWFSFADEMERKY
ncbi:MAG: DNA repair protein RadC, partial [Candidatus Cryptobacteroides sp.]